jgi:peptidoglycan/xylan/chitin deacetylase (PgdA/CDA1 family)
MKFHVFWIVIYLFSLNEAGASDCAYNSEKSMLSRVVAVDFSGRAVPEKRNTETGSNFALPLVLNDKEIVLTFDQGPHPTNTGYILGTLDRFCIKAVFFFTGSAAMANPAVVRDVAQRGHTLAAGPWSASADFANLSPEDARWEIEKGLAAVSIAADMPAAPFFRAAAPVDSPGVLSYLSERGVSLWSYDIASGDSESGTTAAQLLNRVVAKLREMGKGVIQFHDAKKVTVDTLDDILLVARQSGFKVVQPVPAASFTPLDEVLAGFQKSALKAKSGENGDVQRTGPR